MTKILAWRWAPRYVRLHGEDSRGAPNVRIAGSVSHDRTMRPSIHEPQSTHRFRKKVSPALAKLSVVEAPEESFNAIKNLDAVSVCKTYHAPIRDGQSS
ncbi:hypothetical protein J1614_001151 [Plenodomus biglobosus]|nr:hypothetical protein J1614_001151 [Plenodomus biglobosus]